MPKKYVHPANSRVIGLEMLARTGSTQEVRRKAVLALKKFHGIVFTEETK